MTVFIAVDHLNAERVCSHTARRGTQFEAPEPLQQREASQRSAYEVGGTLAKGCGATLAPSKNVTRGLAVRHERGSPYISDTFQTEMHLLSTQSLPGLCERLTTMAMRSASSVR